MNKNEENKIGQQYLENEINKFKQLNTKIKDSASINNMIAKREKILKLLKENENKSYCEVLNEFYNK